MVWVGAAALFGCWTVFGSTAQIFGVVQELSGRSLQDTEHVLELHWSVTGSGLGAGTQGHVWGHPRWDLQPSKRNEGLIVQQHTRIFMDIQDGKTTQSTLTETLTIVF